MSLPEQVLTPDRAPSRRDLLAALAIAGSVAGLLVERAEAQSGSTLTEKQLQLRLLRRISYGPLQADVDLIAQMGYDAYLDQQLNYTYIDDSVSESAVAAANPYIAWTPSQFANSPEVPYKAQLINATIMRSQNSKRQLYQRMVEFWSDHFNIEIDKVRFLKVIHDRDVIRANALGNFNTFLLANTQSPAMLDYLDNWKSVVGAPNQNLARELMELHSIGVDNYTQQDVAEVSRCLTGWTIKRSPLTATNIQQFIFLSSWHDYGSKTVLGHDIPSGGGVTDGKTVCKLLSQSQNTGRNLARKLFKFFHGVEPSSTVVDTVANIYWKKKGDIKAMVREILSRENVAATGPTLKRPYHYTIGLVRQTQSAVSDPQAINSALSLMGRSPFSWTPPDGFPSDPDFWSANLLPRWNFAFRLCDGQTNLIVPNRTALVGTANTVSTVIDNINSALFQGELSSSESTVLANALGSDSTAAARAMNTLGLAAALAGYQYC